jgi:hypothetical protein
VYNVSDARQVEIHTAEPLVPDPSPFEVKTAIMKLKSFNYLAVFNSTELIQAGGPVCLRSINSLILF